MTTKHQPATPLPWMLDRTWPDSMGIALNIEGKPHGCVAVLEVSSTRMPLSRYSQEANAAYIAHTANAYPKLVEALRVELAWWSEELANCNGRDAVARADRRITVIGSALAKLEET